MAVTFEITSTGLTTIDLTDTSSNICLQEMDYVPAVATPTGDGTIPPYVQEHMPVAIHATSYDGYATQLQNLAAMQKRAAEYWVDNQQGTPVWLNCKLDGETTGRKAFVKAIDFEFHPWTEAIYQECGTSKQPAILLGTLLVTRHPYWERTATRTFPNTTPAAAAAVSYDYTATADLVGDVPARVNAISVRQAAGSSAITDIWMGIRSASKHGATGVTAFIPIWESESGTNNACTTIADDVATEVNLASPGGGSGAYVNVNPEAGGATIDWDDGGFSAVYWQTITQAGYATASDAYGRFLLLLRAKVETGTWQVQLRIGYTYPGEANTDILELTNTSWRFFEVSPPVSIPPRNLQAVDTTQFAVARDAGTTIQVLARRMAGAGDLMLDCICMIPVDEGFLKLSPVSISTSYDCLYGQGPSEKDQAIVTTTTGYDVAEYEAETFRLPPGDGRIIAVYKRSVNTVLTDRIEFCDATNVTNSYTERWTALRGSE